jgi:hypothetical protein
MKQTPVMVFLTLRHSVLLQPKSTRPLLKQSWPEPITEYNRDILAAKTKQVTLIIKINNCIIQWLKLAIISSVEKCYQSSIASSGVRIALKSKQSSKSHRIDSITQDITHKKCICHLSSVSKWFKSQDPPKDTWYRKVVGATWSSPEHIAQTY